jgi:hypothetical protein
MFFCNFSFFVWYSLRAVHAATLEHCESDGEKECVKECADWLEHCDVLDEGCVPQESNDEHIDEENNEEDDENLKEAGCAIDVKKVLDHLL